MWQKKRLEILKRDSFTCINCKNEEKQLQVHHKIYYYGRMAWEYKNKDLATLCCDCHSVAKFICFEKSQTWKIIFNHDLKTFLVCLIKLIIRKFLGVCRECHNDLHKIK